jgi:hypothetical protein
MAERKTLTITQVEEIKKVGDNQIPKLSFKAKDGDKELTYFTFKPRFFDLIKEGQTINADVETEQRGDYINRRVVQIYVDGQPVSVKGGYRGKSPEELEQQGRVMVLSYAKDLAVADKISIEEITTWADKFYTWLKGDKSTSPAKHQSTDWLDEQLESPESEYDKKTSPPSGKIQNITEFKGLMSKHKIATHDVYEILSISKLDAIKDWDKAWEQLKKAKGIEP